MVDFAAVTDPRNPFNTDGLSREVLALIQYVIDGSRAMGIDAVVTSTTDHPVNTTSGNKSRHRLDGTDGLGLAIDCRLRTRGLDIHAPVFAMFRPVALDCHELIYAGAQENIKAGRWVAPYATSSHRDHVHVSVNRGVFLRWHLDTPSPLPPLHLEADMYFKDEGDRLAWQVQVAYHELLGRPVESLDVLLFRMQQIKDEGFARVWGDIAVSGEADKYRAAQRKLLGV